MTENKTCGTCKFSRTEKFYYNPISPELLAKMVDGCFITTKCHIQGAPQKVKADKDWCYEWEEDT